MRSKILIAAATLGLMASISGATYAAQGGSAAAAAGTSPAPVITSGPANHTTATTATFAFSDSQSGVTFQCKLDGADWAACASPTSYSGPLKAGSHDFRVRAVNAQGKTSSETKWSWTIDKPPAPSIGSGPADPTFHTSAAFTFSDADTDPGVSFQCKLDGADWAACTSPKSYPGPIKAGNHEFKARLLNAAGDASSETTFDWTISKPPAPVTGSHPDDPTSATAATFTFSDADTDPGVGFQCKLDSADWAACTSPKSYTGLKVGDHEFHVRLLNAAGDAGDEAKFRWKIVKASTSTFPISGNLGVALYPGRTAPLQLTITNTNSFPITVTSLGVTVRDATTNAACSGSQNIGVQQYSGPSFSVPANSSYSIPATSQAPQITMLDLATNQDACKTATFTFDYTGTATG